MTVRNYFFLLILVVVAAVQFRNVTASENQSTELTKNEIAALYAILHQGERKAKYCRFELMGEHHVSVTLVCFSKVGKEEFLSFLDFTIAECRKIERIDFYFSPNRYQNEILERLQSLDNISRIQVMQRVSVSQEFSDKLDVVCQTKNWQRIDSRIHGRTIFFYPKFEAPTKESIRRENLGFWGRCLEDLTSLL